jgi:hypothetical protein
MKVNSPWVTRAQLRILPPSANGARAYFVDDREPLVSHPFDTICNSCNSVGAERIDTGTGTYTEADLQRAVARENGTAER